MTTALVLLLGLLLTGSVFSAEPPTVDTKKDAFISDLKGFLSETGKADFHAACLNVTRDAQAKRLRIFGMHAASRSELLEAHSYKLDIIYHPDLSLRWKKTMGAYYEHNNHLVLNFAASEYSAGHKALAVWIIKHLAQVHPDIVWYSHEKNGHFTIQAILRGLEADDPNLNSFLKEQSDDWKWKCETYGPKV